MTLVILEGGLFVKFLLVMQYRENIFFLIVNTIVNSDSKSSMYVLPFDEKL